MRARAFVLLGTSALKVAHRSSNGNVGFISRHLSSARTVPIVILCSARTDHPSRYWCKSGIILLDSIERFETALLHVTLVVIAATVLLTTVLPVDLALWNGYQTRGAVGRARRATTVPPGLHRRFSSLVPSAVMATRRVLPMLFAQGDVPSLKSAPWGLKSTIYLQIQYGEEWYKE